MKIVYKRQNLEFEWDSNKAQSNLKKHGITFEEATEAFFDPFYQTGDATSDTNLNGEQREFIIGYSLKLRLLLVIFIDKHKSNRIISARLATKNERKIYEQS